MENRSYGNSSVHFLREEQTTVRALFDEIAADRSKPVK